MVHTPRRQIENIPFRLKNEKLLRPVLRNVPKFFTDEQRDYICSRAISTDRRVYNFNWEIRVYLSTNVELVVLITRRLHVIINIFL